MFFRYTGNSFNDFLSHFCSLPYASTVHFSHSLVCWWLFGLGWGGRPWPQAEGLITVLAREQKAEGQKGWNRMDGERWGGEGGMVGPQALTKSSCGMDQGEGPVCS